MPSSQTPCPPSPSFPWRRASQSLAAAALAAAALAGCGDRTQGGASGRAPQYSRPPIVVVNIDTLRADHLGSYGYRRDTSPNLDALAAESVRFEWAFAQAPSTAPSQASILTGRYPRSHGRQLGTERVDPQVETLAEALSEAGYRTAAFVDGGLMSTGAGLEQGFEVYNDDAGRIEKVSARATQWLDDHLAGERRETPFLLMVHTYDVHAPYEDTPARFRQLFLDEVEPRPPNFFRQRPTSKILRAYAGKAELTPEELEYSIALYDGGIRHVDEWFRGFRRYLERRGLWRQSVVVVLSDHGEEFKEHGKLFHEQLFSPVTRIPWILKLPEGVADGLAGHVESTTVESLDMMPTLLDLAEVPTPAGVEGESLMPLLEGENRRSVAVSECKGSCEQLALAEGEWRLIQDRRSGRQHLFRYREDPLEADDQSGPHGERAAAMAKTLEGWEKRVARRASQPVDYTDETLEQLSALGYVDTVRALRSPEEPKPREEIFADDFETGGLAAWEGEESPAAGAEAEKPRGRRAP